LIEALQQGLVEVSFIKVNGERRDMLCTLNEDHLPSRKEQDNAQQSRKENPAVQSVYDVNANGWRSWRWDNVVEFETKRQEHDD
jgi:hypothetical protein